MTNEREHTRQGDASGCICTGKADTTCPLQSAKTCDMVIPAITESGYQIHLYYIKVGIIGNDRSDLAVLKSMILYICNMVMRFSSFPRIPEGCPIPVPIRDRSF